MATQTRTRVDPANAIDGFREGSRWIHQKPSGEELAAWFKENVTLHDGLEHKDYITGIVLIPQKERAKETAQNGQIVDVERLTFTPYPTTGARVAYLRDWIAAESAKSEHPLLWEIVPDESLKRTDMLPGGFFAYVPRWTSDAGKEMSKSFVGCSMQLRVYERDIRSGGKGREILIAPSGSKVVPAIGRYGADENALMKAQTGAIGRTLAFAGMLVIPGTGVATAEDVQEAIAGGVPMSGVSDEAPQATLPAAEPVAAKDAERPPDTAAEPTDLRARAAELIGALQAHPEKLAEVHAWAEERSFDLAEMKPQQALRGAVRKLERSLQEAEAAPGPAS